MAILTESGRAAMAKAIAAQAIHLAWGIGGNDWDTATPPPESVGAIALAAEVGRRSVTSVQYVTPDDNGDVVVPVFGPSAGAGRRRFRVVEGPTPHLYMRFNFEFEDAPASEIRELAVFTGTVIKDGLPVGQRYFEPADILDAGIMLAVENLREKIIRSPNSRQAFEFVLTI